MSTVTLTATPCPRCGGRLLTNTREVWCSNFGTRDRETGRYAGACMYGIGRRGRVAVTTQEEEAACQSNPCVP